MEKPFNISNGPGHDIDDVTGGSAAEFQGSSIDADTFNAQLDHESAKENWWRSSLKSSASNLFGMLKPGYKSISTLDEEDISKLDQALNDARLTVGASNLGEPSSSVEECLVSESADIDVDEAGEIFSNGKIPESKPSSTSPSVLEVPKRTSGPLTDSRSLTKRLSAGGAMFSSLFSKVFSTKKQLAPEMQSFGKHNTEDDDHDHSDYSDCEYLVE